MWVIEKNKGVRRQVFSKKVSGIRIIHLLKELYFLDFFQYSSLKKANCLFYLTTHIFNLQIFSFKVNFFLNLASFQATVRKLLEPDCEMLKEFIE
jgi:hypothetical protein